MSNTQKLTDEQREEVRQDIAYIHWWDADVSARSYSSAEIKRYVATEKALKKSIPLLLSSEQALREESAKLTSWLKNAEAKEREYDNLQRSFNQAIEVLEWYASFWNHDVQLEDIDITSIERDRGKKARYFLSSLQEDKP